MHGACMPQGHQRPQVCVVCIAESTSGATNLWALSKRMSRDANVCGLHCWKGMIACKCVWSACGSNIQSRSMNLFAVVLGIATCFTNARVYSWFARNIPGDRGGRNHKAQMRPWRAGCDATGVRKKNDSPMADFGENLRTTLVLSNPLFFWGGEISFPCFTLLWGDETQLKHRQVQTGGNALHCKAYGHHYSPDQTWLNLKTCFFGGGGHLEPSVVAYGPPTHPPPPGGGGRGALVDPKRSQVPTQRRAPQQHHNKRRY